MRQKANAGRGCGVFRKNESAQHSCIRAFASGKWAAEVKESLTKRTSHPSDAGLEHARAMTVKQVNAVDVVHDGGAEEHVAVVLSLRQRHAPKVQRVPLRPKHSGRAVRHAGVWVGGLVLWHAAYFLHLTVTCPFVGGAGRGNIWRLPTAARRSLLRSLVDFESECLSGGENRDVWIRRPTLSHGAHEHTS